MATWPQLQRAYYHTIKKKLRHNCAIQGAPLIWKQKIWLAIYELLCSLANQNACFITSFCIQLPLFCTVLRKTALFSANQNRIIFSCILLKLKFRVFITKSTKLYLTMVIVPLSTQMYNYVLANSLLGVTLQWTSLSSGGEGERVEILLVASYFRNWR